MRDFELGVWKLLASEIAGSSRVLDAPRTVGVASSIAARERPLFLSVEWQKVAVFYHHPKNLSTPRYIAFSVLPLSLFSSTAAFPSPCFAARPSQWRASAASCGMPVPKV